MNSSDSPPSLLSTASDRRALLLALFGLLLFSCLGVGLEVAHAFKFPWLLGPENETRRLLLRLGHAHGTLLALFSLLWIAINRLAEHPPGWRLSTRLFFYAQYLLPVGFFLAAFGANERDPGFAIALVPLGAILFLGGLALVLFSLIGSRRLRPHEPNHAHKDSDDVS